jgi:hypothetical protein
MSKTELEELSERVYAEVKGFIARFPEKERAGLIVRTISLISGDQQKFLDDLQRDLAQHPEAGRVFATSFYLPGSEEPTAVCVGSRETLDTLLGKLDKNSGLLVKPRERRTRMNAN